jgi:DNA-binding MurR/RpiR family transcriptional regulator
MPTPHTLDELIHTIQSRYPGLSTQLQISARYLIDHPIEVSTLSARKLASRADVQPATLVRLAQYLGYSGWDDMKAVFTRDFSARPGSYVARAQSLVQRGESTQTAWHTAAMQYTSNLNALEMANKQATGHAVKQLSTARRVVIAGFRSCYPAAFSLHYLFSLFRSDVCLLHNTGGTIEVDLHMLNSDDTVVLMSYMPYSREISIVAEAAKAAGCHVISMCDSQLAPIALVSDQVLTFPTQGNSFFPSTVALHALVELLAQQLLVESGEAAISQLAQTELLLRSNKAYL